MKEGYTYILLNKNRTVLYIGATENLKNRVNLHSQGRATEFTKKYNVSEIIYFEHFLDKQDAFIREKQIKNWKREWKWNLIKSKNPQLKNLYLNI